MWRFNRDHLMALRCLGVGAVHPIIPAKAGIHPDTRSDPSMDSRLRGSDEVKFLCGPLRPWRLGVEILKIHVIPGGA
jgi:hypothetical protein